MGANHPKEELHAYLRAGREAMPWKLDGLSEYDARRPVVPTATNLLGLVKHLAAVEAGYLGETFARPFPEPLPWAGGDAAPNADMWAVGLRRGNENVPDGDASWWGEHRARVEQAARRAAPVREGGPAPG